MSYAQPHAMMTDPKDSPPPKRHRPVMAYEVMDLIDPRAGKTIVDGTVGTAGHSMMMIPRVLFGGSLIAMDQDPIALEAARKRLIEFVPRVTFVHDNFRHLPAVLARLGLSGVDGVLLDLGMSSVQVDSGDRGFSFSHDGPLDMRMNPHGPRTAADLVNSATADELSTILSTLGEERFARRIARAIVDERRKQPLSTTAQLVQLVVRALPGWARHGRRHAATQTFQALRLAVNDELGALTECLAALPLCLNPGGRAVILSYHSLEDRLVKRAFAHGVEQGIWESLTPKPLRPHFLEVEHNPRARSAMLRAVEKVHRPRSTVHGQTNPEFSS